MDNENVNQPLQQFAPLIQARQDLVRHASYEIDSITSILLREARRGDSDRDLEHAAPAMLRRVQELTSVIMSVTGGDDERETEEMQEVVHGNAEVAA